MTYRYNRKRDPCIFARKVEDYWKKVHMLRRPNLAMN